MDTDAIPYPIMSHQTAKLPFAKSNSLIALEQMTRTRKNNNHDNINKWSWNLPEPTPEPFVPLRIPETLTERNKKHIKHDTAWGINYLIELGILLFGFSLAYVTYYNIAVADAPNYTYQTGISKIDYYIQYLVAPIKLIRTLISPVGVPSSAIRQYPALFVLVCALVFIMVILWNKMWFIQMGINAIKFQASPLIHGLIAWIWITSFSDWMKLPNFNHASEWVSNIFGWLINPYGNLIALIILIVCSHLFAGFTQWGILGLFAYMGSGLEKYLYTGDPTITLPKPETPEEIQRQFLNTCIKNASEQLHPDPKADITCLQELQMTPYKPSILTKLNSSAYFMLPFARDFIFLGFAIIKLVNGGSLQTIGGKLFSYGVNGTIIIVTLASIFMKFPTLGNAMHVITVTSQPPLPSTAFGTNDPVIITAINPVLNTVLNRNPLNPGFSSNSTVVPTAPQRT